MPQRAPPHPAPENVVRDLLHWFRTHARDLPWRRTRDPYAVWVSEIMLQQTQVRTVVPYWERWMRELPDVAALASAPEHQVLKLWEGLGYYSRARNLQRAARTLLERGGAFPETVAGLLALPGIGRYTAGAIASIAFNQPAPILDGNVIRVLTRLHALGGDPKSSRLNRRLWATAGALVACAARVSKNAADLPQGTRTCSAFNQALMELGALICTPRNPNCAACPLAASCRAHIAGRVQRYPQARPNVSPVRRLRVVLLVERLGRWLVRQRPARGINAGFWEFPEEALDDASAAVRTAAAWAGIPVADAVSVGTVRHAITKHRLTLEVVRCPLRRESPGLGDLGRWVTWNTLQTLPLTGAHRRIERQFLSPGGQSHGQEPLPKQGQPIRRRRNP